MYTDLFFLLITAGLILFPKILYRNGSLKTGIFAGTWENIGHTFKPPFVWLLIFSVAITPLWTLSGLDVSLQKIFQGWFKTRHPVMWPLFQLGNYWHFAAGYLMYLGALAIKDKKLFAAGSAGLQALFSGGWFVLGLKLLTGRRGPARFDAVGERLIPFIRSTDPWDYSFDFWNRTFADGRFFWPSGHTSTIFAFAAAVACIYSEKKWLSVTLYSLAAFMGIVMTVGNFHWSSDVIAGAVIGCVFGLAAGRGLKKRLERELLNIE